MTDRIEGIRKRVDAGPSGPWLACISCDDVRVLLEEVERLQAFNDAVRAGNYEVWVAGTLNEPFHRRIKP